MGKALKLWTSSKVSQNISMKITMKKESLNFIKDFVDKEYNLFQEWIYESIIANRYGQNLFCVFKSKEEVEEYIIKCCKNRVII